MRYLLVQPAWQLLVADSRTGGRGGLAHLRPVHRGARAYRMARRSSSVVPPQMPETRPASWSRQSVRSAPAERPGVVFVTWPPPGERLAFQENLAVCRLVTSMPAVIRVPHWLAHPIPASHKRSWPLAVTTVRLEHVIVGQ
jgi:hypothetical protein